MRAHSTWLERLALLGCLVTDGCYLGSARRITTAELAPEDGWALVEGVPEVRQVAQRDCGAAALAMVLGYWAIPATREDIGAVNPQAPEGGIAAADLRQFVRQHGMQAFVIQGELDDLEREIKRRHPVLVGVIKHEGRRAYPHYEVVVGINRQKQRILTLDPAEGLRAVGQDAFATEWADAHRIALVVFPNATAPDPHPH